MGPLPFKSHPTHSTTFFFFFPIFLHRLLILLTIAPTHLKAAFATDKWETLETVSFTFDSISVFQAFYQKLTQLYMHDPSDLPCPCHVSHLAIASSFLQHGNIAFTVKWRQSGFLQLVLLTNPKLQNQNYIGIGLPLSMVFHLYLNQNHI